MSERFFVHRYDNGLTLLAERMPGVRSAAMTLLLPAGSAGDPEGRGGCATVLSDLLLRGAGERDSRALSDHLDGLGLQRSSTAGVHHSRLGAAGVAARVLEAVPAYGDIVRRPMLPEEGFEAARDLSLQSIAGLEDDPQQKLLLGLRERFLPTPFSRPSMGRTAELEALTVEECRADHAARFRAGAGAIFAVAGDVDFGQWRDAVGAALGTDRSSPPEPKPAAAPPPHYHHVPAQSEQTHIGLACPSVSETDADFYTVRMTMEVLSGGMSGRLFTEVREKRGLVYSVWAGYSSLRDRGFVMGYAGTSNERAQGTLDCLVSEMGRLSEGVSADELARAKTRLKSATIMQGESTSARAGAIAHDYFVRGRIRTLEEIKAAIDGVTLERVNAYLAANRLGPFTVVTVGPKELAAAV